MRCIFIVLLLATSATVSRCSRRHFKHGISIGQSRRGAGKIQFYPASTALAIYRNGSRARQTSHHHAYPASTGLFGNTYRPQQIRYGSTYHPVYQGHLPVYVYEYQDSGSRFDNLLTGLALYNLGRNSHFRHYSSKRQYSSAPGEICKLGISKRTNEYEETRIDCNLMSSFIWEDTSSTTRNEQHVVKNTTTVKVTQTVNGTGNSSVTTVSVTNDTVQDALKVKGPSIAVTPGMTCYLIRMFRGTTALRKPLDCGLLQRYARSLGYRSFDDRCGAQSLLPYQTVIFNCLMVYLVRYKG